MEPELTLRCPKGFSLIEMLFVMAIMVLLMALAIPSLTSNLRGYQITDTGSRLAALIEEGREHATTRHCIVDVRLFEGTNSTQFNAAGLCEILLTSGTSTALQTNTITRIFHFPEPVILAQNSSSLLSAGSSIGTGTTAVPGSTGAVTYRDFLILSDGSTSLASSATNPYLAVVASPDASTSGAPHNPFVLSIDPYTCRVTLYRK